VSVVLVVVECDHRQKINITFGIQKDFMYLLAKQQQQKKKTKSKPNRTSPAMVKRTKCYAYILYNIKQSVKSRKKTEPH